MENWSTRVGIRSKGKRKTEKMEVVFFERTSTRMRRSGRMVVRSPNPVHSVLYRVVVFVNASRRRFLLQVEFRARILRVVYVGAIAVLFRFVVMMLNLSETVRMSPKEDDGRGQVLRGIGFRLAMGRVRRYGRTVAQPRVPKRPRGNQVEDRTFVEWVKRRDGMWGMERFGQVLYSDGVVYVLGAGMVLLVAMIGSIVLTLKVRTFARAKRQQVDQQRSRDADRAIRRVSASKQRKGE